MTGPVAGYVRRKQRSGAWHIARDIPPADVPPRYVEFRCGLRELSRELEGVVALAPYVRACKRCAASLAREEGAS